MLAGDRARLAALGVPLFDVEPRGVPSLDAREYTTFLVGLVNSGDARLEASIPCLLAAHDGEPAALGSLRPGAGHRLALLYRVARCLVRSRRPDLRFQFGRRPQLPALAE